MKPATVMVVFGLLSGCAGMSNAGFGLGHYDILGTYPATSRRTGALLRDKITGLYSVGVTGSSAMAPLENFTEARLLGAFPDGRETVSVIEGSASGCPATYKFVITDEKSFQRTRLLGDCHHAFRPIMSGNRLVMVEQSASDPLMFAYQGHRITQPTRSSQLTGERFLALGDLKPPSTPQREGRLSPQRPAPLPQQSRSGSRSSDQMPGTVGAPLQESTSPTPEERAVFDPK